MTTTKRKTPRVSKRGAPPPQAEAVVTPPPPASPLANMIRGPEERAGHMHMHREDMLLCNFLQSKAVAAVQAVAIRKHETAAMALRHARELHAAQTELLFLVEHCKEQEVKVAGMWADMGEVYGIDFSQASYDDETGKIIVINNGAINGIT